ncbi:peptide chain release factor PrfB3, chloroplastic-like [Camellia sinensis]|uniref:peptide chain release factor PrfB3, chloroplastic-like n=1 Tax=Camellia sinensis TaxID=4442 RepID=UPI001036C80A|nr:peptide chain release factor PrfB3, chloroplastic-like [Camellia sinensis]
MYKLLSIIVRTRLIPSLELSGNSLQDCFPKRHFCKNETPNTMPVNTLKIVIYRAEEAKLITQLAEMDAINFRLFKQAYSASLDVSKFLGKYEMSKLLRGPYDIEGACVIIKAGISGFYPEIWAEQILQMYIKWAEKQGLGGRIVEKYLSKNGGVKSATIEFESKYAYGYLSGERGVHSMISGSQNTSVSDEV